MITRSIIISQIADFHSSEVKPVRGLVTLTGEGNITGVMRVFNISSDILPICMAVKIGDKKYVYQNIDDPQNYNFKIVNAPISDNITIILAYVTNGYMQGIACGHNAGGKDNYNDLFTELNETELDSIIKKELEKDDLTEQDLKTMANEPISQDQESEPIEDLPEDKEDFIERSSNFYSLIQPQLDELFTKFPHFRELEDLVQNTEWIKVSYSQDGSQHYILGKLFDGGVVTHLCYGIPAQSRSTAPPSSLTDYCQWLPLDLNAPDENGYWVMYQNAETGENIKM